VKKKVMTVRKSEEKTDDSEEEGRKDRR